MAVSCRLLIDPAATGAWNMAADEVLLDGAAAGIAALRFYGWAEPTLSLGYFQPHRPAREDARLHSLAWLRRPTGGAAIVHHHELTYSLAIPPGRPWQPPGLVWMQGMHEYIRDALAPFGVVATLCAQEQKQGEILCFLHHTPGDLLVAGHKVAGSAQRKQRGALLQHGSILLRQSPFTPFLPGLAELSPSHLSLEDVRSSLIDVFIQQTGWALEDSSSSDLEKGMIQDRIHVRYAQAAWNEKR